MSTLRRQRRHYKPRKVRFVRWDGTDLASLLAGSPGVEVIYTISPTPGVEALRNLAAADPGPEWVADPHYLTLPTPVLRFKHRGDGRRVEVHRAASYFGEGDLDPRAAHDAWNYLGSLIRGAFDEGAVLTTPASTGRYLLARCISGDREWPVLEPDTQDFIRETTGQGRVQMFGRESRGPLCQYDARLAYGALCAQLPAGEPVRDTVNIYAGWRTPARYLVRFAVPRYWDRGACACGAIGHAGIGLLPVRDADRWTWPAAPGTDHGPTWVDGREVGIALAHGWRVEIIERMMFPFPPYNAARRVNGQITRNGPLDQWAQKLCRLRYQVPNEHESRALVRTAIRAILLFGIGALHGTPRRRTHTVSAAEASAGAIPSTARDVLPLGDRFVWTSTEPAAWPEMSHPEWTSAIWARARVALLDCAAPHGHRVGMLHVPAATVVGCFTDSLYLTADPGWADDGRVGRFRRTWQTDTIDRTPTSPTELRRRKALA